MLHELFANKIISIMSNKRNHKTLTLKEKMEVLKKIDNGEKISELVKEYGVGRATLHDLKKNRRKIEEHVTRMDSGPGKRKTLRVGNWPKMENELYTWFLQERSERNYVSGDALKAKAIELYQTITQKNDFRASTGWLEKFKNRFGIHLSTSGEKHSCDESADWPFKPFKDKIEELGLLPDQVYNAVESCLLWRMLPDRRFVSSREVNVPDYKASEDRISFMPCSNATGSHKFKLVVIGNATNPKALKNVYLPVSYKNQWNSWITREIFIQWFHEEFVPEVKDFMIMSNLPESALLVLDHAPGYPNEQELRSSDGKIQAMFLPQECKSILQPMEQNVIQKVRSSYKTMLLRHIASQSNDIKQCLEELSLKDVLFSLAHSWDSLSPSLIHSSWKSLWPTMNVSQKTEECYVEDDIAVADLLQSLSEKGLEISEEDLNSWLVENTDEMGLLTNETREMVQERYPTGVIVPPSAHVDPDTALKCFTTCIAWAEENGISDDHILVLRNLRENVFKQEL